MLNRSPFINASVAPPSSAQRLLLAGVALCCLAGLALAVDVPLARWIKTHGIHGDVAKIMQFCEVFAHGSGVVLIIAGAVALDPRGWRVALRMAVSAYGAGMIANLLKLVVVRARPEHFDLTRSVFDSFQGWGPWHPTAYEVGRALQSFPSGHTATAAGLACACARLYPRSRWFFMLIATLAGMQRMEASAHFLSDVLTGAALGCLVAAWLEVPIYRDFFIKFENGSAGR